MASRIAALQAKLGGGAMIMGGMRPGGGPPIRKKKPQRRNSLDNSALLDRTTVSRGNRKKKKRKINLDDLEDDDAKKNDQFSGSVSDNINMKKAKPISADDSKAREEVTKTNDTSSSSSSKPRTSKKKMGGMGGMNMKAMLGGGFKRKSGKTNKKKETTEIAKSNNDEPKGGKRDRSTSKSFSKGVTDKPLIDPNSINKDDSSKTPDVNSNNNNNNNNGTTTKSPYKPPIGGGMGGMGGMMMNAGMLNRSNLKKTGSKPKSKATGSNDEEKILEIVSKKHGKRHVRLFAPLDQYIVSKKGDDGKGLQIESFVDNKYGKMMEEKGLKVGWKLTKIAKQDATKMSLFIIKNQLTNQAQMSGKNGYNITFEGAYEKKGASKQSQPTQQQSISNQNYPMSTPLKPTSNQNQSPISPLQQAIPNKAVSPEPTNLNQCVLRFCVLYH